MNAPHLADTAHRDQALDTSQSFSVQAPAGSGKTELLSLRYLKLLSISEQPEEVLAITFTRKAASEMRDRIIKSIAWAASFTEGEKPNFTDAFEAKRFEIANAALTRINQLGWHVLDNPSRLRVQTIDSFCHHLASQLPVLSRLGGKLNVSDEVDLIFANAVHETLSELESNTSISDDIAMLLGHLDNDVSKIEQLLVGLLYKRDQWLTHILGIRAEVLIDKDYLQESLEQLITESLEEAAAGLLPFEIELVELVNFAASNLQREDALNLADFKPINGLPDTDFPAITYWHFLANLLLTQTDTWRLTVDKRLGFPAGDKSDKDFDALCKLRKKQMANLREQLLDDDDLREALAYLRKLPDPALEQQQWDFLSAIARILVLLNAKLLLSFRKFRTIDHSQTGAAARDALINEDAPTDLALLLDHKIQHILVDEFQDTSKLQIDILLQLIAGWQMNDGRTLFVVGDAMQSCYGFRNANVGLFLKVRKDGLGDTNLTPLTLQTNFRSQQRIVDWVNNLFSSAFPAKANSSRGAVPYTDSVAYKGVDNKADISTEIILYEKGQRDEARELEADRVVEQITKLRKQNTDTSIAILVRNRTHLSAITSALRSADIQWQSSDIDRLGTLPVINDLRNLTKALLNLTDRVAWLAVLRAPWCGLNVADLLAVESFAGTNSIWFALQRYEEIDRLSSSAKERLEAVCRIFNYVISKRYRCGLRQLVETSWTLLRGAGTIESHNDMLSVAHFFDLLEEKESAGSIDDMADFEAKIASAFVPTKLDEENPNTIQIMTMHKAKGLEFDHVILPGLAYEPKSDDKKLLQWHERLNEYGESRLFIATLSASGEDDDALYKLLRYEQQHKTSLENTRLLYIATTRAKKSLCLLASIQQSSKGKAEPPKHSLLKRIWRELSALPNGEVCFTQLESSTGENEGTGEQGPKAYPNVTPIKRFVQPLELTPAESSIMAAEICNEQSDSGLSDSTIGDFASKVGLLIHSTLEAMVKSSTVGAIGKEHLNKLRTHWRNQLSHYSSSDEDLDSTIEFIESSIINSITSDTDGWIFDPKFDDSTAELALSTKRFGYIANFQIDRSFVDDEGTRWIIDYKTAKKSNKETLDAFISDQIEQHHDQLENYKTLFERLEKRPVKSALFFTSIAKLVELN